jgi:DNA modification methylase
MNRNSFQNGVVMVATKKLTKNQFLGSLYSTPENYYEIKSNIKEFGLLNPLLVNSKNEIISGNLRFQIALELEIDKVPVVFIDVNDEKKDVISLSTNQSRKKSLIETAREINFFEQSYTLKRGQRTDLCPQLKAIKKEKDDSFNKIGRYKVNTIKSIQTQANVLFDGNQEKVEELFAKVDSGETSLNQLDKLVKREVLKKSNKVVIPEFYELRTEKVNIFNKSCEEMSELEDKSVQTIITSPPYFNMRDYGTGKSQLGNEKKVEEFINNLVSIFDDAKRVLKDEGSLFVNINDCVIDNEYQCVPELFLINMKLKGWVYIDNYLWLKPNPQYSDTKMSIRNFEPVYHFTKSKKGYFFNDLWLKDFIDEEKRISMGTSSKCPKLFAGIDYRGGVLTHVISNTLELRKKCLDKGFLMEHSATFPLALPMIFVLSTSKPGDLILDMFNGTASTGEISVLTNREYVGYELNPQFIMASEVRLEEYELGQVA